MPRIPYQCSLGCLFGMFDIEVNLGKDIVMMTSRVARKAMLVHMYLICYIRYGNVSVYD